MRGEYRNAPRRCGRRVGSSPRAWGIQALCTPAGCRNRFIPTCVGNTRPSRRLTARSTVHPHVRGEYACWGPMVLHPYGSSPRAWGIHVAEVHVKTAVRFIPTCVGNTRARRRPPCPSPVHPHVRGEYDGDPNYPRISNGSSPRAWGIQGDRVPHGAQRRFIPTCVGNTEREEEDNSTLTVHPHVRGEYSGVALLHASSCGSSPRAWGIRKGKRKIIALSRFIPTCVGNTPAWPCSMPAVAVHPHVRGEYGKGRGR